MDEDLIKSIKPEAEEITSRDMLAMAFNTERFLRERKSLVDLACGHKAYTGNRKRMICPRCTEMLHRSMRDGKEDYDSFRKGLSRDTMIWRDDPCRQFNEPTDMVGNFINDGGDDDGLG